MGLFSKIGEVLSGNVVGAAKDAYVAKTEVTKAQIDADNEGLKADESWEDAEIRNSGWKDEYVLLLLSVPLILAFVPWTAQAVLDGFAILAKTPEWYRWLVMIVFTAIYGVRIWRR